MKRSLATGSWMPRLTDSRAWRNSSGSESVPSLCLRAHRRSGLPTAKIRDYMDFAGRVANPGGPRTGPPSVRTGTEGQADLEAGPPGRDCSPRGSCRRGWRRPPGPGRGRCPRRRSAPWRRPASTMKNFSKIRSWSSRAMPMPSSRTRKTTSSSSLSRATSTRPPAGVNLTAFSTQVEGSRLCSRPLVAGEHRRPRPRSRS